jgi:5'-methylthioadenosine phosphorylase
LVQALAPRLAHRAGSCDRGCHTALAAALITAPEARDPELVGKLDAVAGRVLK